MKKVITFLALACMFVSVSSCDGLEELLSALDGDYDPVAHNAISGSKKNVQDLNLPKGFNLIILSNGWKTGEFQVGYMDSGIYQRYGAPGQITVTSSTITFSNSTYMPSKQLNGSWTYEVDDEYDVIILKRLNSDGGTDYVVFDK